MSAIQINAYLSALSDKGAGRLTTCRFEFGQREILITQGEVLDPFDYFLLGGPGAIRLFRT